MINLENLERLDSEKMYKIYDAWPEIAKESYEKNIEQINFSKSSHIVFAGMGGSGSIGSVFSAILSKTDTHVSVVKGYHLPKTVNSESIVIITSVSGNTIESIAVLDNAIKLNAKIIVFSDGGKIKEVCKKNNIQHRNIKKYHSPRASFTSFLYSMMYVLKPILPIKELDILKSIEDLKSIQKKINSKNITESNPAVEIANWVNHTPVIYYPWGLESVAIRFKNMLQENCKIHAMVEDVIEAGHNQVVSWKNDDKFQPILVRGKDDFKKTSQRWEILKELFIEREIDFKEVTSENGNILTKIICLIYLFDYASIYLSIKLETDPTPVDAIDFIKKNIKGI
jgi:glucose/mannose-6-phosphate isomerase